MHDRTLANVREALLRAGVAPRHVNRYVMELRDHLADLVARERSAGLDPQAAEAKARSVLGTETQLVQAMIDRGAPRSFASKAPWAVFGILPLVTLIALMVLLAFGSMAFFAPYRELSGAAMPGHVRALGTLVTLVGSYGISLLLATACIAIALRQRLSSGWVWFGLALIALLSGPFGVHIQFLPPQGGMPGGIRGSILQSSALVMVLRTLVLFALSALAFHRVRGRLASLS